MGFLVEENFNLKGIVKRRRNYKRKKRTFTEKTEKKKK